MLELTEYEQVVYDALENAGIHNDLFKSDLLEDLVIKLRRK
jgi:hypothetical protein